MSSKKTESLKRFISSSNRKFSETLKSELDILFEQKKNEIKSQISSKSKLFKTKKNNLKKEIKKNLDSFQQETENIQKKLSQLTKTLQNIQKKQEKTCKNYKNSVKEIDSLLIDLKKIKHQNIDHLKRKCEDTTKEIQIFEDEKNNLTAMK